MRLQSKLVTAFVAVGVPGLAFTVAAVGVLDQAIQGEIATRTDEVLDETEQMLRDEAQEVLQLVESAGQRALRARSDPGRFEGWALREAAPLRLDLLAAASETPGGGPAVLVSSAHLPLALGDTPGLLETPLAPGETRHGFAMEMVEGNPPRAVPALIAMHAPRSAGGQLWVYGGRRLDHRLLGRVARMANARLALEIPGEDPRVYPPGKRRNEEAPIPIPLEPLPGQPRGILHVSVDTTRLWIARGRFLWLAQLFVLAGFVLAFGVGVGLARRISGPIRALSEAAVRVGAGDLDVRVTPTTRDEVGTLVQVFNRMTEELGEAQQRIQQAERVAAWREVAQQLAHEIRNPLSPMRLGMENLRKAWAKSHPQLEEILEESTKSVLEEVEALDRLVSTFSTFARLPTPEPMPTSPWALLETAAQLYDARVQLEAPSPLPEIRADPELMGRALVNLVKNALEAGGPSVKVKLRARAQVGPENRSGVVLEVEDDGPGMSPEILEKASGLHFTTKKQGSGLGLAIVRRTMEDQNGYMEIASQPGEGARVSLWLPTV